MSNISLKINQVKNIATTEITLPIEKGIYCIAGSNGCGKSTIMSCLAQSVFQSSLNTLNEEDYSKDSTIEFIYQGNSTIWSDVTKKSDWRSNVPPHKRIHFNGMYEGSLFYGTRFNDSLIVDELLKDGKIDVKDIVDADDYVKEKLSYILHGDTNHYTHLRRIRNKEISKALNLKNTPYFQDINGKLISQYRMSSGECLLISLMHFIYNSLVRRSLPSKQPVLMLIDEIELALHPVAVSRLIDLLDELLLDHENLTVILTSHSPEVIRKIKPANIYMLEHNFTSNTLSVINPCYPSYAIRDVYMHNGFDYVILVEDLLAKYIVESTIKKLSLQTSKLINILPVGGWENVLKFQHQVYISNTFGHNTKVISILDGDIQSAVGKQYKSYTKTFLPIGSVEKYLYKVLLTPCYFDIKKQINDTFFFTESIDSIIATYYKDGSKNDKNGKFLYQKIRSNLEKRSISEEAFVKDLCSIIMKNEDFSSFEATLSKLLT